MKIVVKNTKRKSHTICRTSGQRILIGANDYTIIDTEDENEIKYWTSLSPYLLESSGIKLILDEAEIGKLESKTAVNGKQTDVSVFNQTSPIAQEIAKSTFNDNDNVEEELTEGQYSEEALLQMDKEDLFNLCDNFGIKYKRSNSVKTLVALILESGVLE